jgi:hypothetical protein
MTYEHYKGLKKTTQRNWNEYQGITPRTAVVEDNEDGMAGVLDRVLGWCSHNHVYADEQEAG